MACAHFFFTEMHFEIFPTEKSLKPQIYRHYAFSDPLLFLGSMNRNGKSQGTVFKASGIG